MYEINAFFWYKAIFAAELLCAEGMLTVTLKRRRGFWWRALAAVAATVGFAFAMPVISGALYASFLFLAIFAVSVGAMKFCFREDWRKIVFCGVAGYTVQHIASQFFDLSVVLMGQTPVEGQTPSVGSNPVVYFPLFNYGSGAAAIAGNPFLFLFYFIVLGVTYFVFYKIVNPRLKNSDGLRLKSLSLLVLVAIIVLFDVIVSAVVTDYSGRRFDQVYVILLDLTNIFCCSLAVYIQFSIALVRRLEDDLTAVSRLRMQEKEQYLLIKENINMINIKCHDLKHQIRRIGAQSSVDSRTIGEIENVISIYDSGVKTGNDALDVILTEKSLYCHSHNISMTCIADGALLNFMTDAEIYSLFGNIVDNATEAVSKLEHDSRVIGLSVKETKSVVFIDVYNNYTGALTFSEGLPETTKADKTRHGYGMKSVRMIVEKYDGQMNIGAKDGIFSVRIVFPRRA